MNVDLRGRELAYRLRLAREAAGFSGVQVSRALGISQGQLSRIESGQRRATFLTAALLLGMCNVPPDDRDEIVDLIMTGGDEDEPARRHGCWVRPHRGHAPESVATVQFAYHTATTIMCCDPLGIPALVQTKEFMEADLHERCADQDELDRRVGARRQHQEILFRSNAPTAMVYLHETALRALPVDHDVRESQFIYLSMLVGQERLLLRIVPARHDGALMGGRFSLMRFADAGPAVCVPCDTLTLVLEREHVGPYQQRLNDFNNLALSERDSRDLITDLADGSAVV